MLGCRPDASGIELLPWAGAFTIGVRAVKVAGHLRGLERWTGSTSIRSRKRSLSLALGDRCCGAGLVQCSAARWLGPGWTARTRRHCGRPVRCAERTATARPACVARGTRRGGGVACATARRIAPRRSTSASRQSAYPMAPAARKPRSATPPTCARSTIAATRTRVSASLPQSSAMTTTHARSIPVILKRANAGSRRRSAMTTTRARPISVMCGRANACTRRKTAMTTTRARSTRAIRRPGNAYTRLSNVTKTIRSGMLLRSIWRTKSVGTRLQMWPCAAGEP